MTRPRPRRSETKELQSFMKRAEQFGRDLAERVATTFLQAFLATLLAGAATAVGPSGAVVRVGWFDAAMVGLLAAAVALFTTLAAWMAQSGPIANPYFDLGYRGVLTFVQTLLGYLVAAGSISALAFDWDAALLASLVAAGTALLKGLIGLNNRDTVGASSLVRKAA